MESLQKHQMYSDQILPDKKGNYFTLPITTFYRGSQTSQKSFRMITYTLGYNTQHNLPNIKQCIPLLWVPYQKPAQQNSIYNYVYKLWMTLKNIYFPYWISCLLLLRADVGQQPSTSAANCSIPPSHQD